jgi:hypothetical protein
VLVPDHDIEQDGQELIDNTYESIGRGAHHSSAKPTSVTINNKELVRQRQRERKNGRQGLPNQSSSDTREDYDHPSVGRDFNKGG